MQAFRERKGHWPNSFFEMIRAGFLRGIPVDSLGNPYQLTTDGHVLLSDPDSVPFAQKGLPSGYVAPVRPKLSPAD